jgi:type I restriction enzyme M protein
MRPTFDERRDALVNNYERSIVTANEDTELTEYLAALAMHHVERVLPEYESVRSEGFVRNAGTTRIGAPVWSQKETSVSAQVRSLKQAYNSRARVLSRTISGQLSILRSALHEVDEEQTAAMWAEVRAKFDYPVFMARPAAVGITASGETGTHIPNDLPEILAAWQRFRKWLDEGMPEGSVL